MGRRPKIKLCADPACPAEFTGRWLYCEFHRAGRDEPGSKFRKERNRQAQQRRRAALWDAPFRHHHGTLDPTTGVSSPLHETAGQRIAKLGHSRPGPTPIDVTGTPGMTVSRAIRIFMIEWEARRHA